MSVSRRDFFTSLAVAFLGLLGWRPRSTPATPPVLPASQPRLLAYSTDQGGSVTTYTYDSLGRLTLMATEDSGADVNSTFDGTERLPPPSEQENP